MTEYERWLSVELDDPDLKEELLSGSVSYTHLTLPTIA